MNGESAFLKLCRVRRAVRRFSDRPVEKEKIVQCLEAARRAPSASNKQPWRFIVYDDPTEKERLGRAVFKGIYSVSEHFTRVPVLVCLLIKEDLLVNRVAGIAQGTQYQLLDAGIAGEHFVLAAAEQGLGTCWIGWFDARLLVRHLGLRGKGYRAVALIAVGYPAPDALSAERPRLTLADIAFWNRPPR